MRLFPKRLLETIIILAITSLPAYSFFSTERWWKLSTNASVLIAAAFGVINLALTIFCIRKNMMRSWRLSEYVIPNAVLFGILILLSYLLPESAFWIVFSFVRIGVLFRLPRLVAITIYWVVIVAVTVNFAVERISVHAEMVHRGLIRQPRPDYDDE